MIEIKSLNKSFSKNLVLQDLSLTIPDGKIFGLVGINGAGKSTLLRLLSGIYKADSGEILIDGQDVYENELAKSSIFFLPDDPFYANHTTVLNLIDIYKTFYKFNKDDYLEHIKAFKLPLDKYINTFSKGMKRQVFVSLALAIKPKYLFLDEAFDGLDPLARLKFKKAIISLVEDNGTTIIISSHSLRELEDICDNFALLDSRQIISSGSIDTALNKYHKYQAAFSTAPSKDDFGIDFISYQQDARIIKVVVKETLDEFREKINHLNPVIVDEIAIDFEELFIIEVTDRGYLK